MPTVVASSSGRALSATTLTISHTVPAGTDRYLVVLCVISTGTTLSGTYGGVALTKSSDVTASSIRLVALELANPPVGTANVVLTGSASGTLCASVISLTACGFIGPLTASSASGTTASVTVPSTVGGLVLDVCGNSGTASVNFTVGAGQTSLVEQNGLTGINGRLASSSEAGAASVTMSWALSPSSNWHIGALTAYPPTSPAIVHVSNGRTNGTTATLTFAHSTPAGPDRLLVVLLSNGTGVGGEAAITYGGVALTRRQHTLVGTTWHDVFTLAAPTVGVANIVVTNPSTSAIAAAAYAVNDASAVSAWTSASGTSTAPSVTLSSTALGVVLDLCTINSFSPAFTVGAGQVSYVEQETPGDGSDKVASSSKAGAASVTMARTLSSSQTWAHSALTVYPFVLVPDVVDELQADATTALVAAGLTVGTVTTAPSSSVAPGHVISQSPVGGTSVVYGSAVDLVVSSGAGAPVVNAGADASVDILEVHELDDATATEPDGSTLTYLWAVVSGPGTATWQSPSILNPWVYFTLAGTYVVRLTVSDGALSASDDKTIEVGASVAPGNSICGTENVLTWIEQTYTTTDDETETRVTSDAPLNDPSDYYFGKKEPRILELPTISRTLSDTRGQWQAGTMRWREAEVDRAVRQRFGGTTTYPVTRTTDVCRMIRESDWREREPARLMFVGHRLRTTPAEDLSIEIEAGDIMARDLERAGQELQLPQRLFAPVYTPGIPAALQELSEPIIYGRESDALSSATPPEVTATSETGGSLDGIYPLHGWAPMPGPTPPASLAFTELSGGNLMLGDYPADHFYFAIVGLNASGWGDLGPAFAYNGAPYHTLTADNTRIQVSWTNPGAAPTTWRVFCGLWFAPGMRIVQSIDVPGSTTSVIFDNTPDFDTGDVADLATGAVPNPYSAYGWVRPAARLSDGSVTALGAMGGFYGSSGYQRTARIEVDAATIPATATEILIYLTGAGWVPGNPTYGYLTAPVTQVLANGNVYVDYDFAGTGVTAGDPAIEQGAVDITRYYGGEEVVPYDGQYWHRWFVDGHASKNVEVYLNGVGAYTSPMKLSGEYGVDWLAPGHAGYTARFGAGYRDFNGRRYTVVYGRGGTAYALATGTGDNPRERRRGRDERRRHGHADHRSAQSVQTLVHQFLPTELPVWRLARGADLGADRRLGEGEHRELGCRARGRHRRLRRGPDRRRRDRRAGPETRLAGAVAGLARSAHRHERRRAVDRRASRSNGHDRHDHLHRGAPRAGRLGHVRPTA